MVAVGEHGLGEMLLLGVMLLLGGPAVAGCGSSALPVPTTALSAPSVVVEPSPSPVLAVVTGDEPIFAQPAGDDVRRVCRIADVDILPTFRGGTADLLYGHELLDQVASCLRSGPLRGKSVALIGRTDPNDEQGTSESLSESRAKAVYEYLKTRGVAEASMKTVGGGSAKALGTDEASWALDRRVDVVLSR